MNAPLPASGRARADGRASAAVDLARVLAPLLLCVGAAAQASAGQVTVSLADLTLRALANHPAVSIEREAVQVADRAADRAGAAFDPVVRLDAGGRVRTDPVNTIFSGAPDGALAPRTTRTGGTAAVTRLFSTGATATASAGLSRETINSHFAPISPAWLTTIGLEFRQPLLQGRHVDAARRAVGVAATDRARSAAALDRTLADLVAAVEGAYWTLVAARREVDVRRQAVTLAEEQRADTQARIDAGIAAEAEVASPAAERHRRQGELIAAEAQVARAELALKALVLAGSEDPWWDATLLPSDAAETSAVPPALDAALAHALEHRAEVREAREMVARQEVEVTFARDRLRPSLDVVTSYLARGFAGDEHTGLRPPGFFPAPATPDDQVGSLFRSYATAFEQRFVDAAIGLQLSVPLGHRAAHAEFATADAARRQAGFAVVQARQRVAADVRSAYVAVEAARRRIEVARAGRAAARELLQAEQDRFDAGATIAFFVLTRQNELAQAELAETAALVDYRRALVELARASGTLLAQRGLEVVEPAPGGPTVRRSR
jgi:outer membrane protein